MPQQSAGSTISSSFSVGEKIKLQGKIYTISGVIDGYILEDEKGKKFFAASNLLQEAEKVASEKKETKKE